MLELLLGAAVVAAPITIPGPQGGLAGTFVDAGKGAPVVVIIPGSGPTDRDGNNPLGVKAAPYRLLAEALAEKGVSSLRIDKRGMFGSQAAIADPNAVTVADYAADAHQWAVAARKRSGAKCVWLLGHSEGALVALSAGQRPKDLCGLILVSGPGRKLGDIIRDQLKANPANAPLLAQALPALDSLEAGKAIDSSGFPAPLQMLFSPKVQPFLMDLMRKDPTAMVSQIKLPVLIVQGAKDIQVSEGDARALHAAQPKSQLVVIPTMNHVLKDVAGDDRAANLATYADPDLSVDAAAVEAITAFAKRL